ncbi:accessory Sec system translocase SecA2 [Streptococcus sp. BJSWXB6CM1]|jgi:accessory sec system translocase secA2|uniref:Protein translocase subunit SecA n=1 Tax=Streptococcus fermentans TaxID=3095082 RepID=A0ABU5FZQ9_9STRE|nr:MULTISPECIES: accessory Sec system translocase SecA2 [unclassified Streptococcus]MDY4346365.1 accessory Sec system translocase SecA2 [Streptococcus sp. BJSWXB5TM5]MDY4361348.1 accessory Sec system translocase SecA2 [Streptococcus sp. BJSWXB3CM3]MDY4371507.1 accessory Sec system translocase SecA2 [Streptococcus sp. BJSWXB6CM1]
MEKIKQKKSFINTIKLRRLRKKLVKINALEESMSHLSDEELKNKTEEFKNRLRTGETLEDILIEAFAAIREADRRILGMFPFDVQVLGALALHEGTIVEMKTGEGKTLTATLPLYLNALEGKGTILVTTNDYLARRDAIDMGEVYRFMGLTVGVGVFDDDEEVDSNRKKKIYSSDILYTTSTALGFDYLIDNLAGNAEDKFLRSFNYVIIDEADAVLLDSAQTPLIIAGSPRVQSNLYDTADQFIRTLRKEQEFKFLKDEKIIFLTDEGIRYAEKYFNISNLYGEEYFELNRHINLALRAHYLFKKDIDYVVTEDAVELLDNRTGRILEGTRLQSGIHQAIETKEKVKKSKDSRAIASVTYQSLFNMFPKLSGMTGTGKIAENELISTYGVSVVVLPTNTPIRRLDYSDKIYTTLPEKLFATLEFVKEIHEKQQPILLISGTVDIAEIYSRMLLQEGIPHNVLTAKNIAKEALIIAEAGQKGAVTVATSLAGRGTDIKLGKGVAELGGLAVIGTERMANSRIDWQLRGRAGRQGDPGLSQFFVSLEDELIMNYANKRLKKYFEKQNRIDRKNYGKPLVSKRFSRIVAHAQHKSEDKSESARQNTIKFDESLKSQRKKIYHLRDQLIYGEVKLRDRLDKLMREYIEIYIEDNRHIGLNQNDLKRFILENFTYQLRSLPTSLDLANSKQVKDYLFYLYQLEMERKSKQLKTDSKVEEFIRLSILRAIDECWIQQVDHLQQLKTFVSMRQIAQRDSISEYLRESLESYEEMGKEVKHAIVKNVMLSTIEGKIDDGLSIYFV